jgi:hypothetical protein
VYARQVCAVLLDGEADASKRSIPGVLKAPFGPGHVPYKCVNFIESRPIGMRVGLQSATVMNGAV